MTNEQIVVVAETYCGVTAIVVPGNVDVREELKRYERWLNEKYAPSLDTNNPLKWMAFEDWLEMKCGGRYPREEEVTIVHCT